MLKQLSILKSLDKDTVDNAELSSIKNFVPKVEVVGITASNNFAKGNDMFVPFHHDSSDMEDGVKGLSISLEDPYKAGQVKQQLVKDPSYSFAVRKTTTVVVSGFPTPGWKAVPSCLRSWKCKSS